MRFSKRCITSLLALFLVMLGCFSLPTNAGTTYVQTVKANVPIWTEPNSDSTKSYPYPYAGTVLRIVSYQYNSKGKLWYKLDTGRWVYHENVTGHSHSYVGGICTGRNCGYEWPYSIEPYYGEFIVTNAGGGKLWTRPYSNNSTNYDTYATGTLINVVAKTTNKEGHLWYRLSNGYWVFSERVTQRYTISYNANGGSGGPGTQYTLKGNSVTLSSAIPKRTGCIFKGWSTSSWLGVVTHRPGGTYTFSENKTLYAVWSSCSHSYVGGICTKCGYEYPLSYTAFSGTFVVTKADGAKVWSRPYSDNSDFKYRADYGSVLYVVKKVENQVGKTWYQLSNGYWVYSDNVAQRYTITYNANGGSGAPATQYALKGSKLKLSGTKPNRAGYTFKGWAISSSSKTVSYKPGSTYTFSSSRTLYAVWSSCSHKYVGGICTKCGYEYPLSYTAFSGTFVVTKANGAKLWSRPYSDNSDFKYRADCGSVLYVVKKVENQVGKTWYQISNGYWVYSDNVAQRYTITYNANGGSGAPATQYALKGSKLKLSGTKPTRVGYIFKGWSTSSGSNTVSYKAGKSYTFSRNRNLYAVWSVCSHSYNTAGKCTKCAAKQSYVVITHLNTRAYKLSGSGKISVKAEPFDGSTTKYSVRGGDLVQAVARTTISGKTWYKLHTGGWIPSSGTVLCGTYIGNTLTFGNSNQSQLVTTVTGISNSRELAVSHLKKNVGNIDRYGLIPGLNKTVTRSKDWKSVQTCTGMVPQGITFTDDYLLISSYCACGSKHCSVIYVLDIKTRAYLTTLILDDICHVGGLAKQGSYLWVCDTGTTNNKEQKLRAYSYSAIQRAVKMNVPYWSLTASNVSSGNNVATAPSFLCSANGYLYVGTFDEISVVTTIYFYSVNGTTLTKEGSFTIFGISKIQGISIRDDKMVVTSSYKRGDKTKSDVSKTYTSNVYVFTDKKGFTKNKIYHGSDAKKYAFATMVEGCYIGNSYTYFLFESGAKKYRGDGLMPLDWYVGFKNKTFGTS